MEITIADNEQRQPSVRNLMFSAWAGIFVFGIVMAILGAILPSLFERIRFDKSEAGTLFFLMNLAMLVMSILFGPVVDRFGYKIFLILCSLLVAVSLLVFRLAPTYSFLVAAALLIGFGGGGLNGGANAMTSDLNPESRAAALNFLGIFFGFGAMAIPLLIGVMLDRVGLATILNIATAVCLVPFALFLLLRFPQAKHAQGFPLSQAARVVGHPLLWLCGFLLFFQSGNEFTVGGWVSTYLREQYGFSAKAAALILAGYWAAVMVGRLVCTRLVRTVKNETLILASAALAFLAAVVVVAAPSGALAAAGVVLIGLGFAAVFPTTLAVVGGAFPAFSGTAFSVIFMIALTGGMTAPWLAGKIAAASSLRSGLIIPVVGCGMIVVLQLGIMRLVKKRKVVAPDQQQ